MELVIGVLEPLTQDAQDARPGHRAKRENRLNNGSSCARTLNQAAMEVAAATPHAGPGGHRLAQSCFDASP